MYIYTYICMYYRYTYSIHPLFKEVYVHNRGTHISKVIHNYSKYREELSVHTLHQRIHLQCKPYT